MVLLRVLSVCPFIGAPTCLSNFKDEVYPNLELCSTVFFRTNV